MLTQKDLGKAAVDLTVVTGKLIALSCMKPAALAGAYRTEAKLQKIELYGNAARDLGHLAVDLLVPKDPESLLDWAIRAEEEKKKK